MNAEWISPNGGIPVSEEKLIEALIGLPSAAQAAFIAALVRRMSEAAGNHLSGDTSEAVAAVVSLAGRFIDADSDSRLREEAGVLQRRLDNVPANVVDNPAVNRTVVTAYLGLQALLRAALIPEFVESYNSDVAACGPVNAHGRAGPQEYLQARWATLTTWPPGVIELTFQKCLLDRLGQVSDKAEAEQRWMDTVDACWTKPQFM